MFGPVTNRPILGLDDLEAHDPGAPSGGSERRFKCPLCTPAGRHLALNVDTGAWWCHRCLSYGLIREKWTNQPGQAGQRQAKRVPRSTLTPRTAPKPPEPDKWAWRAFWDACEPITYTPGAAYLRGRGIDDDLAYEAGIRYADTFAVLDNEGRAWRRPERCILFPFQDRAGRVVAVNIRFIDVPSGEQKRKTVTLGPRNLGAFMPLGPLNRDPITVVEGPIDALSLCMAGIPALALVGTAGTTWLPEACVLKNVALALDSDERGEAGAERLRQILKPVGARLGRWKPEAKDWNDDLCAVGPEVLQQRIEELYARDFSPPVPVVLPAYIVADEAASVEDEPPADLYADTEVVPGDFDFNAEEGTPEDVPPSREKFGDYFGIGKSVGPDLTPNAYRPWMTCAACMECEAVCAEHVVAYADFRKSQQ